MSNLISTTYLKENLNNDKLVIVDCRFNLMDKEYGKNAYNKNHIKGAIRVDIETELSDFPMEHGGRHPLPSIERLTNTFRKLSINNDSIVIAYDEGDLAGASRLWWILKYLGHEKVYILDGGINEFIKIGGEITRDILPTSEGNFNPNINNNMIVDMIYVKKRLYNKNVAIIDSREYKRYIGEFEPVDKKAGHIPSAINFFWMDILNKEDDMINIKSIDKLKEHFNILNKFKEIIVYCGSGITACTNSLALSELNINHKIYSGSFSDWISYPNNEVNTTSV